MLSMERSYVVKEQSSLSLSISLSVVDFERNRENVVRNTVIVDLQT